jgi:hypothetical protein
MRKFEILSVKESPGGPGPSRVWIVHYRAIQDKKWIEKDLWIVARTAAAAKHQAEQRFGGKE